MGPKDKPKGYSILMPTGKRFPRERHVRKSSEKIDHSHWVTCVDCKRQVNVAYTINSANL